jgi:bifunctional UDP-N-acetylglucosamine pyrophosphorylase/glucosamine-1-phosphate N-acetyltransferase
MIRFINKDSCYIDGNVKIGDGSIIYPNVVIEGDSVIGDNCIIGPGCFIKNSSIGSNSKVYCSHIFDSNVENNVDVGPYAFIHNGVNVSSYCKVGSFVEVKNSSIDSCSKVSHLSYVGDSTIGNNVNVGAGVVTANFDGVNKNKTVIKDGAFIGSNSTLIAPVSIGSNSVVGASSCITDDVTDDSLSIARSRQVNKDSYYKESV